MKSLTKMIIRYTIGQIIFIILNTAFFFFPRSFHFKFFYPIFNRLYLFAPKIRLRNLTKDPIDETSPVIVATNHRCFADFSFVAKCLKKPFTIMIKTEAYHHNIFFKFILQRMAIIPVDRANPLSQLNALEKAKNYIIKKKYSLIIFPEGWYTPHDKAVGKIKGGIGKLAEETGANVVPGAIYGIKEDFFHAKNFVWKDVYIKLGSPISYKDFNDRQIFQKALEKKIEKLHYEIIEEINTLKK